MRHPAHPPRRQQHRVHDVLVAGATAQVTGQHVTDPRLVGSGSWASNSATDIRIPGVQKPHCRPCNSWKACWIGCREPSGRANPSTVPISRPGLHRQHQAAARRTAVHQHGAGAAHAMLAAHVGAGHAQLAAQEIRQIHPRLGASLPGCAIDAQPDGQRLCLVACSWRPLFVSAGARQGQRQCAARQHRGQALAIPGGHLAVARRDDLAAQPRRLVQIVPYAVAARQRRFDRRHAQRRGGHTAQRQRNARQSSRRIERDQRRDRNDGEVPQRRANSRKAWPCPAGQGWTRMLVRISSASSAGVM